jgi:hypothetical protein
MESGSKNAGGDQWTSASSSGKFSITDEGDKGKTVVPFAVRGVQRRRERFAQGVGASSQRTTQKTIHEASYAQ